MTSFFFDFRSVFCLITFLKIIGSTQIKMELFINFLAQCLSKKNIKKTENFSFHNFFQMTKKNGDLCGHKWPKGIICACENFFHFKNFLKTVSSGAKEMEMMLLQIFFSILRYLNIFLIKFMVKNRHFWSFVMDFSAVTFQIFC